MNRLALLGRQLTTSAPPKREQQQEQEHRRGQQVTPQIVTSGAAENTDRPRIAVLVTFWGATSSHADWIVTKLIDGYWWKGAHTPSRVDVASIYIHQHDTSLLGQRVAKAKGIPIFESVSEAVTLGGDGDLAVDGVVIVGEHGNCK